MAFQKYPECFNKDAVNVYLGATRILIPKAEMKMFPTVEDAQNAATEHCKAWTSKNAEAVAQRYAVETSFGMNGGEPMTTRAEIAEMASGFMADFPDLVLTCDTVLVADHHMVYAWTFEGKHHETGQLVQFSGWEEWDLDDDFKVTKSLGWFDADDYERQVTGEDLL